MSRPSPLLRIGELARQTGKTSRALRLYEELELLAPVERSEGGYRLYDESTIRRIAYIDRMQEAGLSLKEVGKLVSSWAEQPTPRDGMAKLQREYLRQLTTIRAKVNVLKELEAELLTSLEFLQSCGSCTDGSIPQDACGRCSRIGTDDGETPKLVAALVLN